MLNKSL